MGSNRKLISRVMMNKVLGNPSLLAEIPALSRVASTLQVANSPSRAGGCRGCRRRRVEYNAFNDFVSALKSLPGPQVRRIKDFVEADILIYNAKNPKTGRYEQGTI